MPWRVGAVAAASGVQGRERRSRFKWCLRSWRSYAAAVSTFADGDRLRCAAPTGALTPQLRHKLQQCKREILDFLRSAEAWRSSSAPLYRSSHAGRGLPVAVGGHNGDVFCYRALARYLGEETTFFGLEPPGLDAGPSRSRASRTSPHSSRTRSARSDEQPVYHLGFCAGGKRSYELGRQLVQGGAAVEFVVCSQSGSEWFSWPSQLARRWPTAGTREQHARALGSLSVADLRRYVTEKLDCAQ